MSDRRPEVTAATLRAEFAPQLPVTVRELHADEDSWVLFDPLNDVDIDIARIGSFWHVAVDDGRLGVEVIDTDPTLGRFLRHVGRSPVFERRYWLRGRPLDSNIEFGDGELLGAPTATWYDRWLERRPGFESELVPIRERETTRFHVHPAFSAPRRIGVDIGAGVEDGDLPDSWHALDEDAQDEWLRRQWVGLCEWGLSVGVDEVRIDTFSCSGRDLLEQYGFQIGRLGLTLQWPKRELCGPAAVRGGPDDVRRALEALHDIPVVGLQARARDRIVFEVYDLSWDSIIVHVGDPTDLPELPRA